MNATADTMTDEALAVLVATKQARMHQMDDFALARAERLILEAPGRQHYLRRHAPRSAANEADELLARHRDAILRGAAERIRAVDPAAAPVHVVDLDAVGVRSDIVAGFTLSGGGFHDLRPILPASADPAPVIVLNVAAEIGDAVRGCPAAATENEIVQSAAGIVEWVALHEYAHVVDCHAAGKIVSPDLVLEGPADLSHVVAAITSPQTLAVEHHGPQWVRALYHLQRRDGWHRRDPGAIDEWWVDAARYVPGDPGDIVATLHPEWRESDPREPLVDVLRRPPPSDFLALFPTAAPQEPKA